MKIGDARSVEGQYPVRSEITERICDFASELKYEDLPERTINRTADSIVDYVASVYAGFKLNYRFNAALLDVVEGASGNGCSSVFFSRRKIDPQNAAMLNAAYCHGADIDDGNKAAMGHVATHVISALSALAEERGASWGSFVSAMVVGYDVFCRLASSVQPHLVHRGFHSTGMAGGIACAAACAKLIGLGKDGIRDAVAIEATQASGLLLVGESCQEVKPLNPARAAQTGIFSALLSEKGVKGPSRPLESEKGWCHAVSPSVDAKRLLDDLGRRFSIDECYMKPYPSCRHTHCGIEAAKLIRESVEVEKIESIELRTYSNAIDLAGRIDVPASPSEAKFSIAYTLAKMLATGHFSISDLDVSSIDPLTESLVSKTRLVADDSFERIDEGIRGARLRIVVSGGGERSKTVLIPKGDPENPLSRTDLIEKLAGCASWSLKDESKAFDSAERLWSGLHFLAHRPDMRFEMSDLQIDGSRR